MKYFRACRPWASRISFPNVSPKTTFGMGGWSGDVSKEPVTLEKRKKGLRMNCDVGEATEGFEKEL